MTARGPAPVSSQAHHRHAATGRMPAIRALADFGRRHHYGWVEHVFGPLLPDGPADVRSRRVAQLIAVTDLYVWKVLRRDLRLSRDATEAAVRDLVDRMMSPA